MKLTLIVLFAFFTPVAFPQQTAIQPASVTKVIRIRYGIAQKIADLVAPGIPVRFNADNGSNVIVLKGNPNDIASAEQTIRELDMPGVGSASYRSKNIELIVSVIGGSDKTEPLPGGQLSEAMESVVKQLRTFFPYKNYQILSSMLMRSSEGAKTESKGVMKNLSNFGNSSYPSGYTVLYAEANISPAEGRPTIHLRDFMFSTNVPIPVGNTTQFQSTNVEIRADIDLREGQKIVAGKANIDSSDLALFVVLTARIVD